MPDGREVIVRLAEAHGGRCRLGIDAPADIKIFRRPLSPLSPLTIKKE